MPRAHGRREQHSAPLTCSTASPRTLRCAEARTVPCARASPRNHAKAGIRPHARRWRDSARAGAARSACVCAHRTQCVLASLRVHRARAVAQPRTPLARIILFASSSTRSGARSHAPPTCTGLRARAPPPRACNRTRVRRCLLGEPSLGCGLRTSCEPLHPQRSVSAARRARPTAGPWRRAQGRSRAGAPRARRRT